MNQGFSDSFGFARFVFAGALAARVVTLRFSLARVRAGCAGSRSAAAGATSSACAGRMGSAAGAAATTRGCSTGSARLADDEPEERRQRQEPPARARPRELQGRVVHRVASLLRRWLLGTHQGGVAVQHLDAYLDEFVFRRKARKRGPLFYRALQFAVRARPTSDQTLVWSRRGRADQERLRGPARGSRRVGEDGYPRSRGR